MKNKTRIVHTPINPEGDVEKYYLILTEIVGSEIVRSYVVKLPLWVSLNASRNYQFYQYIFN